jgi:transglutaminase-like putative cysteine protease
VLSDAIAFRAEFEGDAAASQVRYWRGPVLWDFDGRTWSSRRAVPCTFAPPDGGGDLPLQRGARAAQSSWLFALEVPPSLPGRRPLYGGRHRARGRAGAHARALRDELDRRSARRPRSSRAARRALRLPRGPIPGRTALAEELRLGSRSDDEILARAIAFLRRGRYVYTLEPPLSGRTAVDEFLFDFKAGFCEHFSSAFVFLMRAAGVPARVVTGYQGGELNPIDRIITVRQSDAHAWAEVHLRGRGWVRVDPTAAAAPGRLDAGLARAVQRAEQPCSCGETSNGCARCATSGRPRRTSGTSGCSATIRSASATS